MAKKLDDLQGIKIDEAFKEGYESEKRASYKEASKELEKAKRIAETVNVKANPDKEIKAKRLHISLRPTLYEDLTKIAYINKISLNEQIARSLQEFRDKEHEKVQKYDKI